MVYFLTAIFIIFILYGILPTVIIRKLNWGIVKEIAEPNAIALTFDDGPDPSYTARLLDVLKKHHVKATFFVVGEKAAQRPELLKRMHAEGHAIGIHHYRHISSWILGPVSLKKQLIRTKQIIEQTVNAEVILYRPPWGHFNLFSLWIARNYEIIMWTGIFKDWKVKHIQENFSEILTEASKPGRIFLLHDSGKTLGADAGAPEYMIRHLDDYLQQAAEKGIRFVSLKTGNRE
ncbi:polysaccharide deacetylase family protein [Bacillus sp. ISL-47]|uniref:polysaccharide deacetylase family protein n=1 Tax=Bacillus sp. ISL-47 TaxID=2819130 RepID=UPI001BEB0D05|nr:polysaccharide deacetylase family protein [Bacillus sp. ISL-47]MBT2690942.1 polysaccharide deacetylase family protein [Bacillus sp. ISL-47]MBT2706720.1 polysaccharide deacetylase family protein [Pseudomonas sp. ISL-84]